jgi:putative transposase
MLMPRCIRYIPPDSVVEVTTRTVHSRYLLRPSPKLRKIVLGIIGRAQHRFGVRIHAFVVLSNHWHGLLSVRDAAQLAAFMSFVNGNMAREIGRLHRWRERFWGRRYSAIVVADETAQVSRLKYLLSNGCKENLVARPALWPGPSCVEALTTSSTIRGIWLDRTAEYRARRRLQKGEPAQFVTSYAVELSKLPCWQNLTDEAHRVACADLAKQAETEARAARPRTKRPLGIRKILRLRPHARPRTTSTTPAPLVHASTLAARIAFKQAYRAFVDAFRAAAELLRLGQAANFPSGCFPPRAPFVECPAAAA